MRAHVVAWLRPLLALTGKELRQVVRDRVLFAFILYVFTLNIVTAAGEVSSELSQAALVVHDADRTAVSRELVRRFRPPFFRLVRQVEDVDEGVRMLDRGEALVLVSIPDRFAERLAAGAPGGAVQVLVDTTKANIGFLASSYATRIVGRLAQETMEERLAREGTPPALRPSVEDRRRVRFNPDLDERWFGTVSELLTMLTVAGMLLPAAATVREKERGTIEQLLVSPVDTAQIMLAKVLAMIAVTLAGAALALFGVMQPLYHVPVRGSVVLLFALTALYAFAAAGVGLVVATFTHKTGQVGLLVLLIVMPVVMLSGIRTPWESLPDWLRLVMALSPLHHFIEIAYGILLRGAGLDVLWDSVLAMTAVGAALFAFGAWRFRAQFA